MSKADPIPTPSASATPSARARGTASFHLWLVNLVVGTLVGKLWLVHVPEDLSPWMRLYVPVALISNVATLAIVPGLLFALAHHFLRSWRVSGWVQAGVGAFFLSLLYTDTVLYRLLGYHFNAAVLNSMSTPGAEDAIHLGPRIWTIIGVGLVGQTLLQHALWRWLAGAARRREERGVEPIALLRPRAVCLTVLLPALFVEKGVYAAADITSDYEVKDACRALPLYPEARLARILDPDQYALPQFEVRPEGARLHYPLAEPELPADGPRPNLFLLVIDSWRRDVFTPDITPNIEAFAADARVYEDHLSGGNGTRYGLFSLLYGLHGSYWAPMLAERRSPVLIDTLRELGYDMRVFSSASMNFPEMRDTAWAALPEYVQDDYPSKYSTERDVMVAASVEDWLESRKAEDDPDPFFCFVLLDSPHQPYYNPGGPFEPSEDGLDYIELASAGSAELVERVFNRYKNSVVFADAVAGRLFTALSDSGVLDETVVIVTGDHGEEFLECGFWGHTSNFSPEQLEVPFLLRGPGIDVDRETRPTSHLDVAGSLLELLGADPARRRDYTLGESLFDPPEDRARVVAGWSHLGLWTESGIFRIPVDPGREIEVHDRDWRRLHDVEQRCATELEALERVARECVRFLSAP